jgi:hypothetical protein
MDQQTQLKQEAQELGEHLALLLNAANLTDDVKAGFLAMVPGMNPEQIERLIHALEVNVQNAAMAQEADLLTSLKAAQADYETARQVAEDKAMTGLEEVESILKQAEG